jgi:hypothetical protein
MSFEIQPPGVPGAYDSTGRPSSAAPVSSAAPGRFARVYELEEARRRRADHQPEMTNDRIPDEVWDEVDRAADLVSKMASQGRSMMFDSNRLTGQVVAKLLEPDGTASQVDLKTVVDPQAMADRARINPTGGL